MIDRQIGGQRRKQQKQQKNQNTPAQRLEGNANAYGKGMWAVIGVNVAYSLLVPGVSISGHLGGAVGGIIALLMLPSRATRIPVAVRIIVAVLWLAAVAAVVLQGEALGSLLGLSAALR